ncbi:hypothetical protein CTI12_AA134130 [Artemisia annua]|uniref:DUF2921 domain-containing protein n=1 Tax=Artemisia annua TaxID=35608 RepID=A0A2U1PNA1_ARTAN|nr:hypothetical protein CTI12_AA134130 [Artemisia annua]
MARNEDKGGLRWCLDHGGGGSGCGCRSGGGIGGSWTDLDSGSSGCGVAGSWFDCLIEVVISYPPTTTRWLVNPTSIISISSQRNELDPLFFKPSFDHGVIFSLSLSSNSGGVIPIENLFDF